MLFSRPITSEGVFAVSFLFINVNHDVGYESSESIPISLAYILAALKQDGHEGIIVDDVRDRPLTLRNLEKWIRRMNTRVVGFTVYQSTFNRIRFFSRYIKSRHPEILIILGGPQIINMPAEGLRDLDDIDILIHGEGEIVIRNLASALAGSGDYSQTPGMTVRLNGKIFSTGKAPEPPDDLDEYPSPYLNGILNLSGKNTAILLSSRGCRHVCHFCITPGICKGNIRYHSIDRVIAEMQVLAESGISRFWFADPNFTENRDRTEKLLEEKIRRGINTPFWFQTRTDLLDFELLNKLSEAGADTVAFGLESGSPVVLEQTNKRIELQQLSENIAHAQSLGLETELFTIFGLPGETVEEAKRTMEFVKALGVPIISNSGSQQMQLYFGSLYEKRPEKFGIKPLPGFRPAYLSVGENYETDSMTLEDMRKVRNMWALANEQMEQDVYYKQRVFEILEFLLENKQDLKDEPQFYAFGALSAAAIEEIGLVKEFVSGYANVMNDPQAAEELLEVLNFFAESHDPIGATDRIIFDSRSWIDDIPFMGISGKYWDVLLGRGLLLPEFESGFIGADPSGDREFEFTFPDDYVQEELRGKQVLVKAKIHKVFKHLEVTNLQELSELSLTNNYNFADLDLLREQNEILYYLALKSSPPGDLLKSPSHFLMYVHKLSKLGKKKEIVELARLLEGKPTALNAFADTLVGSGRAGWALDYYYSLQGQLPSSALKIVRCFLAMGRFDEALDLLRTVQSSEELDYLELLLESLKHAEPENPRIPMLDRKVLDLKIKSAVERESMSRQPAPGAIIHGLGSE